MISSVAVGILSLLQPTVIRQGHSQVPVYDQTYTFLCKRETLRVAYRVHYARTVKLGKLIKNGGDVLKSESGRAFAERLSRMGTATLVAECRVKGGFAVTAVGLSAYGQKDQFNDVSYGRDF